MKKFWKTTLAVAMSAFMAASLAACGGGSSSSSAPANTESEAPSGAIKIDGKDIRDVTQKFSLKMTSTMLKRQRQHSVP